MARVGTCQSCGARFKVPESTKASRAKCSKCGGVVRIPAAGGGDAPAAPAPARPAPPARAAPSAGVPAPSRGALARRPGATRGRPAGKAVEPAAADAPAAGARRGRAAGGKARAAGRSPGRRGGGGSKAGAGDVGKKRPVLLIVLGVVVVLGGVGWFVFGGGDDAPAATPASAGADSGGQADDAATQEGAAEAAAAPEVITTPDPDLIAPEEQDQAPAPGEQAAARQAPAPVAPDEGQSGPLDPVLAFEPVPVWPGVTQEQHDAWADLIHAFYMEGKPPRERKVLRQQLDEIDPIDSIPAFINSLIGLDMSDEIQVRNAFELVDYWQERVAKVPHFSFLDFTRMEPEDIDKRVKVILEWKKWAEAKIDAPETIEKYRLDVAAAQAQGASGDG
jgi:hypothetical protein